MVLFFSGTGNSHYVATRLAGALGDELLSINHRLKSGDISRIKVNGRLILVTPTYAWRIPRIVRDWLLATEFPRADRAWFVMTCGSEIGNAAAHNRALCAGKSLSYQGTAQIIMPENYIAMFHAPLPDEAREIISRAQPDIDRTAERIAANQEFSIPRCNLYDRMMSGPVNPLFYAFFVKATAFSVSNTCIGCGKCTHLCPLSNITLRSGRPVWGKRCTHCMTCICSCPTAAIEYGKKSLGQPRYLLERVLSSD